MLNSYINVYRDDEGRIWFEDDQENVELTEWVDADTMEYDEHRGYILPDGRNLTDIIA
ncbi:MAG: hypothetical protein KIG86_06515 [Eubacteriales bacterium]|nr:hypothetical protein [Eubacteriales bacterium]